jgi:hypothetical protein
MDRDAKMHHWHQLHGINSRHRSKEHDHDHVRRLSRIDWRIYRCSLFLGAIMRIILISALCVFSTAAVAQQTQQTPPPIVMPSALVGAIYAHLQTGGTYAAGQELAREIQDIVSEPQRAATRESEFRKKIEDEAKAKEPPK